MLDRYEKKQRVTINKLMHKEQQVNQEITSKMFILNERNTKTEDSKLSNKMFYRPSNDS